MRAEDDEEQEQDSVVRVQRINLNDGTIRNFIFQREGRRWQLSAIRETTFQDDDLCDFLNFYAHFMADTAFQRASLAEPLKVVITSEDGEDEPEVDELNADEWTEMLSSIPLPRETMVNVDYGQACISTNRKTLLLQGISNGMQMKFQFYKDSDGWKLKEIEY